MKKIWKLLILVVVGTTVLVLYHVAYQHSALYHHRGYIHLFNDEYPVLPHFLSKPKHSREWYIAQCFDGHFPDDMEAVFTSALATWSEAPNPECAELYRSFTALFEVHHRYSYPMELSKPFAKMVKGWLGGDPKLLEKVNKQHIIHVYQPLTSEHVAYNLVRSHRPIPHQARDVFEWVDELSSQTAKTCDFCKYQNSTAVDEFGRQDDQLTVRVSNTFKLEAWHNMIVTKGSHHPTNLSLQQTTALFRDATTWMQEVSRKNPHYIYPNIVWDTLPPSGASQVHPHLQIFISPDHYYGSIESSRSAALRFMLATGDNYYTSMVNVHAALGLVVEYGDAVALALLSGKGEVEVMLLSAFPGEDLYTLVHLTILAYHDTFRHLCKSLAGAWPALGTSRDSFNLRIPAIVRLVSRGNCLSSRSDRSALEIFGVIYRQYDPWQVAAAIRTSIKKHDNKH